MSSNSSTSGQLIALPQGGGALHGIGETFAPDLYTGTGNFTIPIALPPGRNGFQPDLKLVHSTGNGNGPFGLGWSLSIPGVSRKTARGVPRYDDRDVFILSGAEDLVPVERPDATLTRYQPRTEGLFAEIFHHHSAADNYWEVRSKDGLVSIYGTPGRAATDPATLCDPDPTHTDRVFAWRLTETRDPFGNRIVYEYLDDEGAADNHRWRQPLLSRIRYIDYLGPNGPDYLVSVSFAYEARPDPFSSFRAGFEVRTTLRCTRIVVSTHAGRTRVQRVYHLVYLDQRRLEHFQLPANGVALLSQMWIEGRDDSSPNLLTNGDFRSVGPAGATTSFSGLHGGGNAAAANWSVWSNQHGVVATAIEPPAFAPAGPGMIHVTTSVPSGGLVQTFGAPGAGPDAVTAGAWIFVRRGRVGIGPLGVSRHAQRQCAGERANYLCDEPRRRGVLCSLRRGSPSAARRVASTLGIQLLRLCP